MAGTNEMGSVEGQLVGLPLAGPETFTVQQLAYLKRALGVDETVLWSGTASAVNATLSLNEAATNFEYLRFFVTKTDNNDFACYDAVCSNNSDMQLILNYVGATWLYNMVCIRINCNQDATTLTIAKNSGLHYANGWAADENTGIITKIVGIHRIAGGN